MAINLITPPTGGAPLTTADYNAQNVYIQPLVSAMYKAPLHLTEWDTLSKPGLKEGVYINHGGAFFQVQDSNYEFISGTPTPGRVYIKVIRSGDTLIASDVGSATGYSWNYVYNGFYHSDGSQLLPYVIFFDTPNYHKYLISHAGDTFDIASDTITFQNDLVIKNDLDVNTIVAKDIQCVDSIGEITIQTRIGNGAKEFALYYPISAWIDNSGTSGAGSLRIYQDGGWRTIRTAAAGTKEYALFLNPGSYQLLNGGGVGESLYLLCTGVYGMEDMSTNITS